MIQERKVVKFKVGFLLHKPTLNLELYNLATVVRDTVSFLTQHCLHNA
jgi:hypothetical protein